MDRGGCIDSFVCARWKNVSERVESLGFSSQILGRKSAQFNSHSLTGELLNCVGFWLKKRGFFTTDCLETCGGKKERFPFYADMLTQRGKGIYAESRRRAREKDNSSRPDFSFILFLICLISYLFD